MEMDSKEGVAQRLRMLGYGSSDPQGLWGVGTQACLTLFQMDSHLPATGKIDHQTATELEACAVQLIMDDQ